MKGRRPALLLVAAAAAALPAWPAAAQVGGDGGTAGTQALLGILGLSCGLLLFLLAGAFLFHAICLFFATRLAGLHASFGRAALAVLATVGAAIPVMFVFGLFQQQLSVAVQNTVSQLLLAAVETLVIKALYQTGFGRAVLSYLVGSIGTTLGLSILLILIF